MSHTRPDLGRRKTVAQNTRGLMGPLLVILSLTLALPTAPATAAVLDLTAPKSLGMQELEIGDDLWVQAYGLAPAQALDLVLADDNGNPLRRIELSTGRDGSLGPVLLWFRTGVVGCDPCRTPGEIPPLEFSSFPEAETSLLGRTFSVRLEQPAQARSLPSPGLLTVELNLVQPRDTRFFFSDQNGCPRYRFGLQEDVYLGSFGLNPNPIRVFLVGARPSWTRSGSLFHEIRGFSTGVVLWPRASSPRLLAWGGTLPAGAYAGVLRDNVGDTRQVITGGDFLLIRLEQDPFGPTADDGLLINEWENCGDFRETLPR